MLNCRRLCFADCYLSMQIVRKRLNRPMTLAEKVRTDLDIVGPSCFVSCCLLHQWYFLLNLAMCDYRLCTVTWMSLIHKTSDVVSAISGSGQV